MGQKGKSSQTKYIDMGERGRYCVHNKLNELTGKEWIIYSKTFKINQSSTLENFLETIAEKQIIFFTKSNQLVVELLSYSNTIKKVCANMGREYFSIPVKDEYFLGNLQKINFSEIPKADYIISFPFNLITLDHKKTIKGFITDYKQLLQNLVSFYKAFLKFLQPKQYLSVIANNFYIKDKSFPFAFDFSCKFGKIIKQSDEMVFIYNSQKQNNKIPKNLYSIREHIYSFQFRNEKLPDSFKTLDKF